jgi:Xaa-Pro aminopeptidase
MALLPFEELKDWDVDAVIIENPLDIKYLLQIDLSSGFLIINDKKSQLFVDGRYIEDAKGSLLKTNENILNFIEECGFTTLGFDEDNTSFASYHHLKDILASKALDIIPLKSPIKRIRAIKTPEEIIKLKKAANLNKKGFEFVKTRLVEGVKESDIAKELKIFWLENAGATTSFEPIIAFGKNSSKPHYRAGQSRLEKNDVALVDIGVCLDGYHSDATKTYLIGDASDRIKQIYTIVEEALEETLKICKPGHPIINLDQTARNIIKTRGFEKDFKHSIGHGLGLEVHEYPILKAGSIFDHQLLKEGMCITIEPGIYLEGFGGVRLEKSIVITKNGYEEL